MREETQAGREGHACLPRSGRIALLLALEHKQIDLHEPIVVRLSRFSTQVMSDEGPHRADRREWPRLQPPSDASALPPCCRTVWPFYNCALGKKGCSRVIDDYVQVLLGRAGDAHELLDDLKEVGFKTATTSGLSIAITDMRIPLEQAGDCSPPRRRRSTRSSEPTCAGAITERERHNQLLDIWAHCREPLTKCPQMQRSGTIAVTSSTPG